MFSAVSALSAEMTQKHKVLANMSVLCRDDVLQLCYFTIISWEGSQSL